MALAAELAVIGSQKHFSRILQDRLSDAHLAVVEVQERSVLVDRADADDADIHLELA